MDWATVQRIQQDYPAYAALLDIPDVANLLGQAATEGWDMGRLQANLYATSWWQSYSDAQRNAQILGRTDPAQYERIRSANYFKLQSEARRLGYEFSAQDLVWLATRATDEGWNDQYVTLHLAWEIERRGGPSTPGVLMAQRNSLIALGRQYGVSVSEEWANQLSMSIAKGDQTMDGAKQYFYNQALFKAAAEGNEQISEGLRAGFTVWEIMAPTLGTVAEELEIPVNTLDLTTGLGQQVYNYRDPDTNQIRVMTQSEATQLARSQEEWKRTNRAGTIVSETTNAISQAMGVKA